ncbi:carbon-monoxide dehydrogenase medium subunit [Spinactinospora alkalitolerans]|uniref:Carbon-monoxide dehydrogenase medium subunit n=1 Tax=Spinactinospora alkalitolerans TaxID=687207 RepID=A0A852U6R9_9ACTN|nr:xanthine dehydrogenase family protein subunit M [Spinactinospora alkalitolerans]NYE49774.1 carbon-monoxide dehydrogenase medium subunit [Spinactinospora alkalitolerans]
MIPPRFEYVKPGDVTEAVRVLGESEEAKVLAGGQSLMPLLRFRLAYPDVVVDLGGLDELRGIRDEGPSLWIGAMTTHYEVVRDPLVEAHCALLAQATGTVADPAVRHRGTLGGSLSHADPAGDLPAVALTLDAEFLVTGPGGQRSIPAAEFFVDYLTTALEPDDVLTAVRIPKWDGWSFHYEKFTRTAQSWAIVGVAAAVRRGDGEIAEARVGLTNMGSTPVRAHGVESAMAGVPAQAEALHDASAGADAETEPPSDVNGQADYRRHLARVLTGRALAKAAGV